MEKITQPELFPIPGARRQEEMGLGSNGIELFLCTCAHMVAIVTSSCNPFSSLLLYCVYQFSLIDLH